MMMIIDQMVDGRIRGVSLKQKGMQMDGGSGCASLGSQPCVFIFFELELLLLKSIWLSGLREQSSVTAFAEEWGEGGHLFVHLFLWERGGRQGEQIKLELYSTKMGWFFLSAEFPK